MVSFSGMLLSLNSSLSQILENLLDDAYNCCCVWHIHYSFVSLCPFSVQLPKATWNIEGKNYIFIILNASGHLTLRLFVFCLRKHDLGVLYTGSLMFCVQNL